jgi:muramoyltetrapeptide carboxypeptidase
LLPPPLKAGSRVVILATARPITEEELRPALRWIERQGWRYRLGHTIGTQHGVLSAPQQARLHDLQRQLADPEVEAVWFARGGYGSVHLVDAVDWRALVARPKWLVGFSDTTLLLAAAVRSGLCAVHGPMPVQLKTPGEGMRASLDALAHTLQASAPHTVWDAHALNREGEAKGVLVGGNLSILYSLMGSATQFPSKGVLLFLEEVDEYLYHLDRMLWGLRRSGFFEGLNGVVVGGLTQMKDNEDQSWGASAEAIVAGHFAPYRIPVAFGFPGGHMLPNRALLLGAQASLRVDAQQSHLRYFV